MRGRIYDKLCAIDDSGRAEALSNSPTVKCSFCGAKAFDPNSVCEPWPLAEEGRGGKW